MAAIPQTHLNAFVDGELDLNAQLEMEKRLDGDPTLGRDVESLRSVRASVREHASYHAAPTALRERLAALAGPVAGPAVAARPTTVPPPGDARPGNRARAAVQRWLAWRPLAAGLMLAALLALAAQTAWLRDSAEDRIAGEVVASHVRATLGQHLVDVASSDHHTVKPFLSARLGFSPPVSALALEGSQFLGGRVDYLDGRPVAALVYKQGEHIVTSFVWPTNAADREPSFGADRGYLTAHWARAGMAHWVISDVNGAEFRAVVAAVAVTGAAR